MEMNLMPYEIMLEFCNILKIEPGSRERVLAKDLDWTHISKTECMSQEFLIYFKDYIDFVNLSPDQYLSEETIRVLKDYLNWDNVGKYYALPPSILIEFKHKLHPDVIKTQNLYK